MPELLYSDLTYKIRKAVFNVYNTLGYGHKEQIYQKALMEELTILDIPYKAQPNIKVSYKDKNVGNYIPDFLIDNRIIIEIKALEIFPVSLEKQLIYYLKSTGYRLGLLVNFGLPKLVIKRLIWTTSKPKGQTIRVNP